jgi:dolichyl-phosphate-mannose--protein O-mannosyl transferase
LAGSSKIVVGVVVAGLLTAFVLRGNHSLKRESPTWDETMHMDYGLNFLSLGSKVPARDHPYPVVALLTLPLFFHEPAPDQISEIIDLPGTNLKAELRVVEDPRNLWPARQMNLALATLGVALATLWLYRRSGAALAVAFCAIATFDPSWLAHARYITTDVTQGLAFLGGAFALNSFRERPNWRSLTAASSPNHEGY